MTLELKTPMRILFIFSCFTLLACNSDVSIEDASENQVHDDLLSSPITPPSSDTPITDDNPNFDPPLMSPETRPTPDVSIEDQPLDDDRIEDDSLTNELDESLLADDSNDNDPFLYSIEDNMCLNSLGVIGTNPGITECGRPDFKLVHDIDLSSKNLNGIQLASMDLTDVIFVNTSLIGSTFDNSLLSNIMFQNVDLADSSFDDAEIHDSDLRDLELYNDLLDKGILIGLNNLLPELIIEMEEMLKDTEENPELRSPASTNERAPSKELLNLESEFASLTNEYQQLNKDFKKNRKKVKEFKKQRNNEKLRFLGLRQNLYSLIKKMKDLAQQKQVNNKTLRNMRSEIKAASNDKKTSLRQKYKQLKEKGKQISQDIVSLRKEKKQFQKKYSQLRLDLSQFVARVKDERNSLRKMKTYKKTLLGRLKILMKKIKEHRA